MSEPSAFTFIGMDVSKEAIAIAMLRPGEHAPLEQTIANGRVHRRGVRADGVSRRT